MRSSGTGGPFLARVGSFGSPCAAHTHTRARARACTRPRCTLQHTVPLHCTSTTTAHLCTCALTCALRSGASGRGGLYWARHGWAAPIFRRCGPLRGLQNTIPLHCTCSTHAHFCICALTYARRRGASGRGGRCRARHGWATPFSRRREPRRGLQTPQQEAAWRFAMALQLVDKSAAGHRPSSCGVRHASIMP